MFLLLVIDGPFRSAIGPSQFSVYKREKRENALKAGFVNILKHLVPIAFGFVIFSEAHKTDVVISLYQFKSI